jgi:hypothetical protein
MVTELLVRAFCNKLIIYLSHSIFFKKLTPKKMYKSQKCKSDIISKLRPYQKGRLVQITKGMLNPNT